MPIQNEEDFKKWKRRFWKKNAGFHSEKFQELSILCENLSRNRIPIQHSHLLQNDPSLGGSDIHYDVKNTAVDVRLRIDGNLTTVFSLTFAEYKLVLERLKYKSNMKLNFTQVPQDGKYRIDELDDRIDVRVSRLPVKLGEKLFVESSILRILFLRWVILDLCGTSKRQIEKSTQKKRNDSRYRTYRKW